MTDFASLGIEVDSRGYLRAAKDGDRFTKSAERAERSVERLARQSQRLGREMQALGRTMSMRVTAPLLAIAGAATKMGADFDSELTKINTLVGVSREEIAGFRSEILRLAPALGRQPQEMASALFAVTSAGQRGAEAMNTLEAASKAAAIGLGDTRSVALAATAAVTAYGRENLNASEAVEILVGTIEQGNVAAEEVAPVLGRVIGLASEMGVAFEDVGGFIASFTRLGVDAAEATTALRGALSVLQRPTAETRDTFAALGMSVEGFRDQIRDDGFTNAMQDLVERSRELNVDLSALFPNVRALSGVLGVYGGEAGAAGRITQGVADAVGTLDDRFEAMIEQDPSFAFQQMRAELSTLLIEISANILPAVLEFTETVRDLAQEFRNLDPQVQTNIVRALAFAAAIGPLLIVLGSAARLIGSMASAAAKLAPLLARVGLRATGLAGAAGVLAFKIGEGLHNFATFEDRAYGVRDALDATTESMTRFSEEHQRMLNNMHAVPQSISEIEAEIAKLETQHRRMSNQFGEDSVAAEGVRLRLEQLRDAWVQLGGAIEEMPPTPEVASSAFSNEFEQSLNRLAASLSGEVAQAQQEHAELVAHANDLYGKGEIGAGQLERALALYGDELAATISVSDDFVRSLEDIEASMGGPVASATLEFNRNVAEAGDLLSDGRITLMEYNRALQVYAAQLQSAKDAARGGFTFGIDFNALMSSLRDINEEMQEIAAIEWGFENLIDSFDPLSQAMRRLEDDINQIDLALNKGLISDAEAGFWRMGAAANATFGAMMQGVDRTSSEYRKLEQAQQIVNVAMGIAAILQQGMGDPYTAIPRMAAMAAMVASLGVQTGGVGGGGTAQRRQDTQGRGSVLGDAEAQSESILNATEITADATSSLVGINRGMLRALQTMQQAIGEATGMLARGAGQAEFDIDPGFIFSNLRDAIGGLGGQLVDPLGLMGSLLGGSAKITDEGIAILGGTISDLLEGGLIQAFQEVESRSWRFGRTRTREGMSDIDESLETQFGLIIESIAESVRQGAVALGLSAEEIDAALESFRIEEMRISLMDLSADEQQAELEAVFGQIFDNLASHVIPFVGQFQRVGEGMGETLVRVATSVQVTEEAVRRLGFGLDAVDPEHMAQISVGLVEAAGGLDRFIDSMSAFVDKFATDEHKFMLAQTDMERALEQVGMAVPDTRDAMWELMQSLDATTAEGQEQIATLLRLTDTADTYYSMLEDEENKRLRREMQLADLMADIHQQMLEMISPAHAEYNQLAQAMADLIARAEELGASERQLGDIRRRHTMQMQAFAASLRESIADLSDQLFGVADDVSSSLGSASRSVGQHMSNIRDQMINALQGVQDWLDRSLLSNISSLTPEERQEEAGRQFFDAIAAAQGGDVDAMQNLPRLADQFLGEASTFWGTSTAEFRGIEESVREAMKGIAGMSVPDQDPTYQQMQSVVHATESAALSQSEQLSIGSDMLQRIAVLSRITGDSPSEIANELGVPIGDLMEIMGDVPDLTGDALETYFDDMVGAIDDEISVLLDTQAIEQSALDTLLRIEGIIGNISFPDNGEASFDQRASIDREFSVPNAQAVTFEKERNEVTERLDARMERIESILQDSNRHHSTTARATSHTDREIGELVILERRKRGKPDRRLGE